MVRYLILQLLYQNNIKSRANALSLKDIQDMLAENGNSYVYKTLYNKLNELLKEGCITNGIRKGNAITFYITTNGIKWLNKQTQETIEPESEVQINNSVDDSTYVDDVDILIKKNISLKKQNLILEQKIKMIMDIINQ